MEPVEESSANPRESAPAASGGSGKLRVLTIIGSPRKGNTFKMCQSLQEKIRAVAPDIEFEDLHLKDANIGLCRGCQVCLLKGGEMCPLKDDIPGIIGLLDKSDAFILASPGYNQHVPGMMKNFIDRFSHICHAPRFFEKNALVVATVGGMGLKPVLKYLSLIATCWGAHVVGSLGVMIDYLKNVPGYEKKIDREMDGLAHKLSGSLTSGKRPVPSLNDLTVFASLREETRFSPHFYGYWKQMGWTERDYYYEVSVNPLKILIARLFGYITRQEMAGVFKNPD